MRANPFSRSARRMYQPKRSLLARRTTATALILASALCSLSNEMAIAAVTAPAGNRTKDADNANSYKLPSTIRPSDYELSLTPDLKNFVFDGNETITLSIAEASKVIVLNALDINFKSAEIEGIGKTGSQRGSVTLDPEHELARIEFPNTLEKGEYKLRIAFSGTLNDKLRGFYRSYYTDPKGQKHWLATTQMEPTDARRMFPGFDEPEMKATFKISTTIDKDLTAISNGAVEKEEVLADSKKKVVTFESSPKMSSYLVALIIGDFKSTETKQAKGVPIRVWAPAGKEGLGKYALDEACKILEFQTDYFGIPYPAKKLDLIAIPDFRSGAMENMGAITFREASLLFDEQTGSNFLRRRASGIVAHEIAHQWFGDLVTMRWWDDIWLNEAFASWMATKTVNVIHPEWQENTRSVSTRNEAMAIDELSATRAIHADVLDPKQAAEMFDPITYDKGESVLGMLETFVNEKVFQKGIHDYLLKAQFGNATSEDLWQSIGNASKSIPVPEIMKTWVFQAGFPLVKLSRENGKIQLTQERFYSSADGKQSSEIWQVPLTMRPLPESKLIFTHLLNKKDALVQNGSAAGNVILGNAGGNGFYRVQYEAADLDQIMNKFELLSAKEKLVLINDITAQVLKGTLPVERTLQFIPKAKSENNPLVQEAIVALSISPYDYLNNDGKVAYRKLLQRSFAPIKDKVGWTEKAGEDDAVKDLRATLLAVLGTIAEDPNTIEEARQFAAKYFADRKSIPSDIAKTVLGIVAYNGGEAEYKQFIQVWKGETIPELEKRIFGALAHFQKAELVENTLDLVMSDEVRSQDGFGIIIAELGGSQTKAQTWLYVKKHWDEIVKKFPPRSLAQIALASSSFNQPQQEADLKTFYAEHPLSYGKAAVARMLELVHQRVGFRQRNEKKIQDWVIQETAQLK